MPEAGSNSRDPSLQPWVANEPWFGPAELPSKLWNINFTGQIYPNMEHGNIEWWLPGRLPPPRFPSGYSELLVSWAQSQVSQEAAAARESASISPSE